MLVVGRTGEPFADAAASEYGRRLARWGGVDQVAVKAESFRGDVAAVRSAEGERVLGRIAPRDRLVALDERGDDVDGPGFTALVDTARQAGATRLVFAIGGAYGHDPAVRARAWRVIRLSSLVLNHEVARVVLYEQLYRAYAALHGVPYAH